MKKYVDNFMQYRFLLSELVKKGNKLKYRRSNLVLFLFLLLFFFFFFLFLVLCMEIQTGPFLYIS